MSPLKLYRGISVSENEAEETIEDIKKKGLYLNPKQTWSEFTWKDLKSQINELYNKENLTREDTTPASKMVEIENGHRREYTEGIKSMCFADRLGAKYYATTHNKTIEKNVPLLIEIEADVADIAIDGRDFLYTVFGFIDPNNHEKTNRQLASLKIIYGERIEFYIEKLIKHPESEKFAICDLITIDNDIINSHYKNDIIIGGRYGTIFKSAFFVKVPILPEKIISVNIIKEEIFNYTPMITLNEIIER